MDENRILLVGNGINDAQKISWNDMLNFIQDKLIAEGKIKEKEKIVAGQTSVSPTLLFDSLCKKNDVNEEILRELVKDYVEDKSNFVKKLHKINFNGICKKIMGALRHNPYYKL